MAKKRKKKSKKHWMKGAVKPSHKGLFSAKAKRAGMSTHAYATKEAHASGKLGAQARLALVFGRSARKKRR